MKKLLYILLFVPSIVLAQDNSIKTTLYNVPTVDGITTDTGSVTDDMKVVVIKHLDGLGRPIQIVAQQQTLDGKDMISPIEYGILGQQEKQYLPFPSSDSTPNYISNATVINNIETYYSNAFGTDGQNPYYGNRYERSSLGRIVESNGPGTDWTMNHDGDNDHTVKVTYRMNDLNTYEEVKIFKATSTFETSTGIYSSSLTETGTASYSPDQLFATVIRNENWTASDGNLNSSIEFRNAEGQVVLKRTFVNNPVEEVNTYFVYDQFGNLSFVIPPAVTEVTDNDVLDGFCYQYRYDHRNRQVMKKLPGKQWEYFVYDKLDRIIATGPANSPFGTNEQVWLVTKFDIFGRVAYTGWLEVENEITEAAHLAYSQSLGTKLWEDRASSGDIDGINAGYTNDVFPTNGLKLLTINYYDNYDFPNAQTTPEAVEGQEVTTNVTGLQTGRWIRILGADNEPKSKLSVTYYDKRARIIGISAFRNDTEGYTSVYNNLDFTGRAIYSITKHKRKSSNDEIYLRDDYRFNTKNLLEHHTHTIGLYGTPQLLAKNTYNDFGQLVNKKVGGEDLSGTGAYQSIDYSYNMRGWLKTINNPDEQLDDDLFALRLNYNTTEDVENEYEGTKLFNGSISEAYWRSKADNVERKYGYYYDEMNRVVDAIYQKKIGSVTYVTNSYNESVQYDLNGNIKKLNRNGYLDANDGTTVTIDDLHYTYFDNSNKLKEVSDDSNLLDGFRDGNQTGDDFEYDLNGNLSHDKNKGIDEIIYNHLSLPVKIIFSNGGQIRYIYDAIGTKLEKIVETSAGTTSVEYRDGFQYIDEELRFFPTAEGYVDVSYTNGTVYTYVFNYKDHLGNIRVSYGQDKDLAIIQENNYYPFGLKHENYNAKTYEFKEEENGLTVVMEEINHPEYQYKFNGKEWQDELGLNTTAMDYRQYDNAIGRFNSVDALAEIDYNVSPYAFGRNNPISLSDPSGLSPDSDWWEQYRFDDETNYDEAPGVFGQLVAPSDMTSGNNETGGDLREAIVYSTYKGGDYDKYGRIEIEDEWEGTYFDKDNYGKGPNPYSPSTDPTLAYVVVGIVAAPVAIEIAGAFLIAEITAALSEVTVSSALTGMGVNATSQYIANGGNAGDINLIEVGSSIVPAIGPTIIGETFNLSVTSGFQIPNSFDQWGAQVGGGLISHGFGKATDNHLAGENVAGQIVGEFFKGAIETSSNAAPSLIENK